MMRQLTISNQTSDSLRGQFGKKAGNENVFTVTPFSHSSPFSHKSTSLLLSRHSSDVSSKEPIETDESASLVPVKLAFPLGKNWKRIMMQADCPWTIYHKKISRKSHVLVVHPSRDTSRFLAEIPNSVPLSSLMLPGTHESMALYGWPFSQCQSKPLDTQLHAGIRVIDIRLSIKDGRLIAYHGIQSEVTPFADMLVTLHAFLTAPSTATETVVVSIKQEDSNTQPFPKLVLEDIVKSPGGLQMWFVEDRIPTLGEVRGKAVMFSRFGSDGWDKGANGIHPTQWPDSAKGGFQWECNGTQVRTQDWYAIPSFLSIPGKTALATELLIPPSDSATPTLSISFSSASSVPLALPPMIARGIGFPNLGLGYEGVNRRIGQWMLDQLNADKARIRGWLLMDYYEDPTSAELVPLLVECNFRGRKAGEEGWS